MKKNEDWDDGRTVADMSGFERHGRAFSGKSKESEDNGGNRIPLPEFSAKEKFAAVMGTLKAALLIAFVFLGALALAIFIMTLIWC